MKTKPANLLLAATTALLASTFSAHSPAQALTWTINNGTVDSNPATAITGSFTIDNENSLAPNITFSNLMIDGLTFTAADVINISLATPSGSGIQAIDWLNGLNSLSFVFDSPLTTAAGTILLNNIASDFNGDAVSGSVTAVSPPPTAVPEPSALLGLAATFSSCVFLKRKLKGENQEIISEG
ncbi:MAG: PEP-CTERM sorting domain-containing protein [Microcystis sp. LE19-338.1B]|jgi:hypothetical protein|nr:PEP-CTERM sorting domain-containing protein [Microcystis sp. LE19-338.1B]MCZ8359138.1 PEP-CTERM sorting domain-containing protein [Microcystis sp. LE19-388.1G]